MRGQGDSLGDKPHLYYFIVSVQSDHVLFVDRHKYWALDGDFDMRMGTNQRLINTFVRCHNFEVLALLPCSRPRMYVLVPDWWAG